jgi:hypothetical protein
LDCKRLDLPDHRFFFLSPGGGNSGSSQAAAAVECNIKARIDSHGALTLSGSPQYDGMGEIGKMGPMAFRESALACGY